MPLFHGKSKSDFNYDDSKGTKPHSLAMAYGMKRREKKAHGGMCAHGGEETCPKCTYPKDSSSENDPMKMERMAKGGATGYRATGTGVHEANIEGPGRSAAGSYTRAHKEGLGKTSVSNHILKQSAKEEHERVLGEMRADKGDRRNMAEGGMMHAEDEWDEADYNKKHPAHYDEAAMMEDDRKLGEHGEVEEGPQGTWMAEGGEAENEDGTDMVGRIIAQRQRMFSKGGQVANEDEIEAGHMPNEFDDLHLRDELEQHDTGENSGDYIGDEGEDERREDIVSRIMRSRRKGPGHNPRPA